MSLFKRASWVLSLFALLALADACSGPPEPGALLESALERLGGRDPIGRSGGIAIEAEGTLDRGAERQGHTADSRDPGPYRETLAWAPDDPAPRVAWEYRHERTDGTLEHVREIYDGPREKHLVVLADGFAVTLLADAHRTDRDRLIRRLPSVVVAELLDSSEPPTLASAAPAPVVAGHLSDGTAVRLTLDDALPARLVYTAEIPTLGAVEVAWTWSDYRSVEGVGLVAHRYGIEVDSRPWVEQRVTSVRTGEAARAPFRLPDGYEAPQRVELPADGDPAGNARVEELADGVWRVRGLRTGFHPLFVELPEGIVAIDAPAGYPLLGELPAGDVAPGPDAAWLSRRFVDLIRETVPDRPISHVVVTHYHGDHAGGLEAFVEAGAEVVASPGDAEAIRAWLPGASVAAAVDGHELGGGRLVLHEVGANPHTGSMLVAWLPDRGILFVSDLFTPVAPERYPLASHERLDRAFGEWLAGSGLEPERVYSMHSVQPGGTAHLERLRPDAAAAPEGGS